MSSYWEHMVTRSVKSLYWWPPFPKGFLRRAESIRSDTDTAGAGRSMKWKGRSMLQWGINLALTSMALCTKARARRLELQPCPRRRKGKACKVGRCVGWWKNSHFQYGLGVLSCCRSAEKSTCPSTVVWKKAPAEGGWQPNLPPKGESRLQPLSWPVGCSRDNTFIFPCFARALPLPPYHSTQDH